MVPDTRDDIGGGPGSAGCLVRRGADPVGSAPLVPFPSVRYGAPKVSVSRGVPSLAAASEDHSHSASVPEPVSARP